MFRSLMSTITGNVQGHMAVSLSHVACPSILYLMIYSIAGMVTAKKAGFVVIQAGGVGYKVNMSAANATQLPPIGGKAEVFCAFIVKQDAMDLYGFLDEKELELFELLTTISGVGPKTALGIMGGIRPNVLLAAVEQKKVDVLAEYPGIGKKKAERIILELRDKIKKMGGAERIEFHEGDRDIKDALKNLGYKQKEIDEALKHIPDDVQGTEARLKTALKLIGKK